MSLRLKLIILFLAAALIPLVFVSTLTFHNYKKSLETACLSNLQNTAAFKADKVEAYFDGLKDDIKMSQGFYNIKENLPVLIRLANDPDNPQAAASRKILQSQLQQMQSVSDMTDIMLVNPEGKIVYANKPGHYFKDMSKGFDAEQKAFTEGKSKIYFSDAYFDRVEDNRFEMLVTAPASDFNGKFIGVIAFEVDMATIYKVVQEATGLGNTGEILVGKKTGSQIVYISPLRHEPLSAIQKTITLGAKIGGPIQNAVQGKMGAGRSIDYRGQNVIAAWRYIPSLDWGLVAKIDTDEAFIEVIKLRNLAFIILAIVIVLSSITAFSIARSIAEPIKKLSDGAAIIGSGNLDYRIATPLKDEVGQLSRAFDKMTHDLKQTTASRDELNREIAERKQAEEALVAAHRRLVLAQESAGAGIWDWDIRTGKLDWSPELFRLFGLDPKEQPSFDLWRSIIHPQDGEQAEKRIEQAIKDRTALDSEYRIFLPDSQVRWVNALGSAVYDENGKPQRLSGICIDITERKEIERALWDSQKRFSSVFHTSPAGIFVTRMADGLFLEANDAYLQIIGYSTQEIHNRTSKELNIWANQEDRDTIINLLRQHGRVDNSETLFRRKNGEIANILFSAVLFEQAGVTCILGALMDVTERKKAEEALRKNEATLRGILDATRESIWLFSADGFVLTANQTALSRFGKSAEEILGKHMNEILPAPLAQLRLAKLEETVKSAQPVDFEDQRGDMVFHHSFYPVKDSHGRVHSVVSFSRDITERLQAEKSLRQSQEDLNRAQAVAHVGSWQMDLRHDTLTWSDEAYRIFNVPEEIPLTYELFLEHVHPDDRQYLDTKWKAALGGDTYDIEHRIIVDGQIKWVREKAELEIGENGILLGGFGTVTDITERKQAEEALRKSRDELEIRVKERTHELAEIVNILENEVRERIAAEKTAKTERKRFEDVLEMMPAYAILLTEDYHVAYANRTFRDWFGDDNGKKCYEFLFNRNQPCEDCQTYTVLKTQKSHFWEWTGPNGHNYDIYDYPFTDTDGSPLIMEIGVDVTTHKKAQEAVRQGEERYRSLTVATTQVVWTTDAEGQVVADMPAWRAFTGQSTDQIQQWGWINALHPNDRDRTTKIWTQSVQEKKLYQTEYRIRRHDGVYRYMSVRGVPVIEPDGRIREWVGTCTDITERKLTEEKQAVTKSLLELFIKNNSRKEYLDAVVEEIRNWSGCHFVGIRIRDSEQNIPYESSVGFEDDFLAKENFLHLGRDNCTCMRAILEVPQPSAMNLTTDGGSFHCNDSIQFSDGLSEQDKQEYRGTCFKCGFQSIAVIPIRYRNEVVGAIHITDLKKDMVSLSKIQFIETTIAPLVGEAVQRFNAESQLEKYRQNLEELVRQRTLELEKANRQLQSEAVHRQQIAENLARSNKDLEQFAYVASHDLQEPLRAVSGFVELLKQNLQGSLDDKTAEYMNFTIDGARRMQSLVNGLLEYSRVSAKSQKPEQIDSKAVLDLAIAHLLTSIKESGAAVAADDLPRVHFDAVQLTQLFQNLIGNAIKFHGQQPPQIHISAVRQGNAWRFAVADNGIGIEPQYAERIFLIFHRLHTRQKYPGTGIGLAICKKIIERHGGKIWVESKPDVGSTFYFTIPDTGDIK